METLQVLVTDDELGMRRGVARTLTGHQLRLPDVNDEVCFEVTEAASGEEALSHIESSPPDILLLDYKMPGMSGLDVLDHVRGLDVETLTVMITAYASIETAVVATKRGAYDFLAKPFTPDELRSTVGKAAARLLLARQNRKLAEERQRIRFDFVRVLGHELRAPLGAIRGYLDLFRQRALGETLDAYTEMITRCESRLSSMDKLVDDLLDMTHIESGQRRRNMKRLNVAQVARASVESFLDEAAQRNITIQLHAPAPVWLPADRAELDMLLSNLLSNAVKYNRAGGRVDVRVGEDDEEVVIRVTDTGIGIDSQDQKRLFREFVRIKSPATRGVLGSGLGLAIVKKLVALYDGRIHVDSTLGEGSTFHVALRNCPPVEDEYAVSGPLSKGFE